MVASCFDWKFPETNKAKIVLIISENPYFLSMYCMWLISFKLNELLNLKPVLFLNS